MTYIKITKFLLINWIEKDRCVIETCRLKKVILIQTHLSFVLSRKIVNVYNDIARRYRYVTVKDFRKYEKLECKKNKLKLNIDFLNNCKELGVYPKFLIFKPPIFLINTLYQFVKDSFIAPSRRAIKNSKIFQRNSVYSKIFSSTQLPNIYFYIPTKSIKPYNKKRCKNCYTLNKSYLHWRGIATYLYSQLPKLLLISRNMNYPRKHLIYLKQVYSFQSDQIKFENPKPLLLLTKIHRSFLDKLKPRKPKVR